MRFRGFGLGNRVFWKFVRVLIRSECLLDFEVFRILKV